ncbi:MAG: methyltransferase domain-containing protein [Streptosporangiaceae bacterium]
MIGDAFGALMAEQLETGRAIEVVERDDGFIGAMPAARYFVAPQDWIPLDVAALDKCTGRVLDIGAGAGRAALALQDRGHDVLALDISPESIRVCQRRGVRDTFTGTVQELAHSGPEPFDTFVLLGNNLGLLEGPLAAAGFLAALAALAGPGATLVGINTDPYGTQDPVHLGYHERNRAAGRAAGQLRLRVRHRQLATPWFDYLLSAPEELERLVAGTSWRFADVRSDGGSYLATLAAV